MKHRIAIALTALTLAGAATPAIAQADAPSGSHAQPARSSWG